VDFQLAAGKDDIGKTPNATKNVVRKSMDSFQHADRELIIYSPNESFRWNMHRYPHPLAKWHHHPELEIHLVQLTNGRMMIVMTGPNLPHNFVSDNTPDLPVADRDVLIQFTPEFGRQLCSTFPELAKVEGLFTDSESGLEFSGKTRNEGARLLKAVGAARGPQRLITFLELLIVLSEKKEDRKIVSYSTNRFGSGDASSKRLAGVMGYIYDNYTQDIFLSDVAKLVAMEASTFSRFFRKRTGHNFIDFIILLRVHHACGMLTATDLSITVICYESGFNNTANFNDKFRKICGTTPSQYRANALKFVENGEGTMEIF
jgi:AraC-like DNA-binding protein